MCRTWSDPDCGQTPLLLRVAVAASIGLQIWEAQPPTIQGVRGAQSSPPPGKRRVGRSSLSLANSFLIALGLDNGTMTFESIRIPLHRIMVQF